MNFMYFLAILIGPLVKILYSFIGNYANDGRWPPYSSSCCSSPSIHQQKSSAKMAVFQPLMNEIQQKYKTTPRNSRRS